MSRVRLLRSGSGYVLSVAISALVGVISVPVVIHIAGASAWATVAVAQAIGAIAATFVAFGWPVVGPATVAAASDSERGQIFAVSLVSRGIILVPAALTASALIIISVGWTDASLAALLAGFTPVVGGLTASWFFVGESRPGKLNTLDVIPRAAGSLLGICLIAISGDLLMFVIGQFSGQILALTLSWFSIRRRYPIWGRVRWKELKDTLVSGGAGFWNAVLTSIYQNSPLVVVTNLVSSGTEIYAMADRLFRIAALALAPVTQVAQGHVPAASTSSHLLSRVRRTITIGAVLAVVSFLGFGLLAPLLGSILSHGAIDVPFEISLFLGAAMGLALMSSLVGRACLVPLGRTSALAVAATAAAIAGVGAMAVGGLAFGVSGVAGGYVLAEVVAFGVILRAAVRAISETHQTAIASEDR